MTLEVRDHERVLINMDDAQPAGEHTYRLTPARRPTERGARIAVPALTVSRRGMRRAQHPFFIITAQSAGGEVGPCHTAAACQLGRR